MKSYWYCVLFGHRWYKGKASWCCMRKRCSKIIAAPKQVEGKLSLDCRDGLHDSCDEAGGCDGCPCHFNQT